ncbi:MAG: TRAP transporter TatT component family protein [bacterium]
MPAVSVRSDAALVFGWVQRLTPLPAEPIRVPRENTIRFLLPDARVLLRLCALLSALIALALLTACSPRHLVVQRIADELPTQGQVQEEDLQLAREAAAFYLKLSESMLGEAPDHVRLSEAAAGGFTQKSDAFVAFEADQLEVCDVHAAQKPRERAARLYRRAHGNAMAAPERLSPAFARALAGPFGPDCVRSAARECGLNFGEGASHVLGLDRHAQPARDL